ncbi:eight-cysteine-cluster domain-containing protein [Candidatus Woesearchaeota archaeon]|nr:eight-cysteine-cluster domain-containing protein [Candidatus Woesearchaeota archaeon]
MKNLLFLFLGIFLVACSSPAVVEEKNSSAFCGTSSLADCSRNSDCAVGGCSSQICQSASAEPSVSTCEYRDCYDAQAAGVSCGCFSGKCQWE